MRRRGLSLLAVVLGLAAVPVVATSACSADRDGARAPRVPVRVPLASRTETPQPLVHSPLDGGVSAEQASLLAFSPLLAEPALAAARAAYEAGDLTRAAREVEAAFAKSPPEPTAVQRSQFLLARLRELASDYRGAAASYDLAAAASGSLTGYARLGAGRMLLRAGLARECLARSGEIVGEGPLGVEAALLDADAARLASDVPRALSSYRTALAHEDLVPEPARALLELAELLVADGSPPLEPKERESRAAEALGLAERARARAPLDETVVPRAERLIGRALLALPAKTRAEKGRPDPTIELGRVRALVEGRAFEAARDAAESLLAALGESGRSSGPGCETELLRARALGGLRQWGKGSEEAADVARRCSDGDLRPRALFLAGKYSDADKRYALALREYEVLEHDYPAHKLADDARLRAAETYLEMGAEGRFTELLTRMPDDYPAGDMVLDGLFALALHRMEKGDWASAESVLARAATTAEPLDGKRGQEFAGRERYFRARARGALGNVAESLSDYETLVRELPLSYYMLLAYSRLSEADPKRAEAVLESTLKGATGAPFPLGRDSPSSDVGFVRAVELLRVGDVTRAKRELDALGVVRADAAPAMLWAIALLYGRAGAPKLSNDVARGLLTDWLVRWPAGDWARAWEIAFPRPFHDLVLRETKKNDVPESLVYAVMREESSFDPEAESPAKAYGLMQLIVPTARQFGKPIGLSPDAAALKHPAVNVGIGVRVLSQLTRAFPDNPLLAIPSYNAGAGKPRRWLRDRPAMDFDVWVELIPYVETRRYTKRVLASRASYAFLYARPAADLAMRLPIRLASP